MDIATRASSEAAAVVGTILLLPALPLIVVFCVVRTALLFSKAIVDWVLDTV